MSKSAVIPSISYLCFLAMGALSSCIGTDIVEDSIVDERLAILTAVDTIRVGDAVQFRAVFFDNMGDMASDEIAWSSSDNTVLSVDGMGLVMAEMEGTAYIRVMASSRKDSVKVVAGEETSELTSERVGMFQGKSSYTVEGSFGMSEVGENLELVFGSDFRASNGPGLYVYLSDNADGVSGGIEVGELQANSGAQTYLISKDRAELFEYDFVHIYCRPFGVPFGYGEFDN